MKAVDPRLLAQVLRRARRATASAAAARLPFPPERAAVRCGIAAVRPIDVPGRSARLIAQPEGTAVLGVDRRIPPHSPQWNGLVAFSAARLLLPAGVAAADSDELAEAAAAELLLPARWFAPIAARTDLTMDGVRDLAGRFSAPIRLAVRQWLLTGNWAGFALLWREGPSGVRLAWRAASRGISFPPSLSIGARPDEVWRDCARLNATLRTGRPHHSVEEVSTGAGPAWWFTRFGAVRDGGGRAVLALVILDRRGRRAQPSTAEGIDSRSANRKPAGGRRSPTRRRR